MSIENQERSANGAKRAHGAPRSGLRAPRALLPGLALAAWALGVTMLLDRSGYGLDEATARTVLFLWSVSDQVASPIVTLGLPDFRVAYLVPAGVFFSGSLLAVKLGTLLVWMAVVVGIFRERARGGEQEAALPGAGLMLIAPLAIEAIDHVAIAPYLLITFLLGAWADAHYRAHRIRLGGAYFVQLVLCIAAISLHPAGLALPLVLALGWRKRAASTASAEFLVPGDERSHMLAGIGIASVGGLALAHGWPLISWFGNPIAVLGHEVLLLRAGSIGAMAAGVVLLCAWLAVLWRGRARLAHDRVFATVALAGLLALTCADEGFALLVLVGLLGWGFDALVPARRNGQALTAAGRAIALLAFFFASTYFLMQDRGRLDEVRRGIERSDQDQLIASLVEAMARDAAPAVRGAAESGAPPGAPAAVSEPRPLPAVHVASQWPGRTMIACRCSALPLPPAGSEDGAAFLRTLRGLDYVIFDPREAPNRPLANRFAMVTGEAVETVALEGGGVVLRVHPPLEPARPAPPRSARDDAED